MWLDSAWKQGEKETLATAERNSDDLKSNPACPETSVCAVATLEFHPKGMEGRLRLRANVSRMFSTMPEIQKILHKGE